MSISRLLMQAHRGPRLLQFGRSLGRQGPCPTWIAEFWADALVRPLWKPTIVDIRPAMCVNALVASVVGIAALVFCVDLQVATGPHQVCGQPGVRR